MVRFFVSGIPVSKGSAKAFHHAKTGKIIVTQDNREKQESWALKIKLAARQCGCLPKPKPEGISLRMEFVLPFPKKEWKACTGKPDIDKLVRCVFDALTGTCYEDDSQVERIEALKIYGTEPRLLVEVD